MRPGAADRAPPHTWRLLSPGARRRLKSTKHTSMPRRAARPSIRSDKQKERPMQTQIDPAPIGESSRTSSSDEIALARAALAKISLQKLGKANGNESDEAILLLRQQHLEEWGTQSK